MPGLGLEMGLEKPKGAYSTIIDILGGVTTSGFVLGYSLYRLTVDYTGYCLKVRRSSDNATQDIGFVKGFIDKSTLESFCAGTNGYVDTWYNQYSSGNNAVQSTLGSQPQIVNAGSMLTNNILFDGLDDRLPVTDYAAIQITSQPMSYYLNLYMSSNATGYVFNKSNGTAYFGYAYLLLNPNNYRTSFNNTTPTLVNNTLNAINKNCIAWIGAGAADILHRVNANSTTGLGVASVAACPHFNIGCRANDATNTAWTTFYTGYMTTFILFNKNQYQNYAAISAAV